MSANELNERLDFMRMNAETRTSIQNVRQLLMRELPGALDSFYEQVRAFPQTRKFFADDAKIAAAKSKQLAHWEAISSGRFDANYMAAVTAIGEVHARIGLEPRWYIGGYGLLLEAIIGKLVEAGAPKGAFGKTSPKTKALGAELGAVAKATLLDMDLAISVYLETLEKARLAAETERKVLEAEQERVVSTLAASLKRLAQGDLTTRIDAEFSGRYQDLKTDFNQAMESLVATMTGIAASTDGVTTGSNEIAVASDDLARRTEQQAASLEQTAAALDEVTATVKRSADGANRASDAASKAKADAARSGEVMTDAIKAMGEIEQSSQQITQIISVIDEIAFQTNLLALNAGVEAARAGDAGRGFAVVAQEVRALAQRSADAAKEIKSLIANSTEQVQRGVNLVGDTGKALQGIVVNVAEIDGLIAEIALSSREQSSGLSEVNIAVNQMDQVTQQNAAMVEQATAAAANLKRSAVELKDLIGQFQIDGARRARSGPELARSGRHTPVESPVARAQSRIAASAASLGAAPAAGNTWEEF